MLGSRASWPVWLLLLLVACGGGNKSPSNPAPAPTPSPTPAPAVNPCSTVVGSDESLAPASAPDGASSKRPWLDGDPRWNVLNSLWLHAAGAGRNLLPLTAIDHYSQDVGDIAVLQDAGDIIVHPNQFDLGSLNLRFAKNGSSYDLSRTDSGFRTTLGNRLTLDDDDTSAFDLPFTFSFFGKDQARAFVNSDGNITFEDSDTASSDRSVSRFLTGPPRVAPFFADLDPTKQSGRVYLQTGADGAAVTWCNVRDFDNTASVSVQAVLVPDGTVELHYASDIGLKNAVVGVSPGRTGQFLPVDLSTTPGASSGAGALGERFSASADIDLVALSRRFYQSHADSFDQIVVFTDAKVVGRDTFAYESLVANEVRGLGIDTYDTSRDFGSAGRLRSIVLMDVLSKYPNDPKQRFLGENNTVSVMGQEVGHRWLAFLRFRDASGQSSAALLGRDKAHWSFFMDSDASVMEGNDIKDLGGGAFETVDAVRRYSRLDQYAMGLVSDTQVPTFFYVESPTNVQPSHVATDDPDVGTTFNGTRRDVTIQDVIDAMGRRNPSSTGSPRVLRQAFVYVVSSGSALDQSQVDKLDTIRRAWVTFFGQATSGRMQSKTSLN
jgi:hypothetical protein